MSHVSIHTIIPYDFDDDLLSEFLVPEIAHLPKAERKIFFECRGGIGKLELIGRRIISHVVKNLGTPLSVMTEYNTEILHFRDPMEAMMKILPLCHPISDEHQNMHLSVVRFEVGHDKIAFAVIPQCIDIHTLCKGKGYVVDNTLEPDMSSLVKIKV
jgi:hypothetical protein